ncbi:uncharacterized protein TRUGW13939_04057 [Talaromyces rugulosus]|uniref:TauD/TfdA-like domain-containing protein n=1 Tax=Talaromyces rugulosus TaxID=121627 RepID=A0A7H8QSR1_TALRU|nr:uncharacterized protein TRUGW13939_04057 [Talaromyces rugulosus]QKX56949.1 hypothetical protein TRUGW13939_04057 [Talaromyces rugulosus]
MTETITLNTQTLFGAEDAAIETFEVPVSRSVHGKSFPLGIKPRDGTAFANVDDAAGHIAKLAEEGVFNSLLTNHGAILFRGFPLKDAADLTKFIKAFKLPHPHEEVGLSGKRRTVGDIVKTANEEPPHIKFYYHNEYGRSAHFPGILFFFSEVVPEQGGQTPLLSTIELYDKLQDELPEFVKALIAKGITGRQYYPAKEDPDSVKIGWNWQDSFGFDIKEGDSLDTQRRKVENVLETRLQAKAEWQPNGALHVLQHLPAFRRIVSTGQIVPFNGLGGVYGRQRDREALLPPYKGVDDNYHLPTTYGDGSEIPHEYLERLLEISDQIGFLVPWKEGDVALIDNYTVQHARSPWVGERSLLVSLWDSHEKLLPV